MRRPLLNIAELIEDPDFCQTFKVIRREGLWELGRFKTTDHKFCCYGVIDPQPTKEMQFNPDGVLIRGTIKLYTHKELYITQRANNLDKNYNSDIIVWQGNQYIIVDEDNYSDFGYHAYTCQLKDAANVNEY